MSRCDIERYSAPPPRSGLLLTKREVIAGVTAAALTSWSCAKAHEVGLVAPPVPIPQIDVITSAGDRRSLCDLLAGHTTAVQLMFTRCRSICPIEAATLSRVQDALGGFPKSDIRLLSLSTDPTSDTPERLRSWLERFNARPIWTAAAPVLDDLSKVRILFDRRSDFGEEHSTFVSLIDSQARLVWRTSELPSPQEVAKLLDGGVDVEVPGSE